MIAIKYQLMILALASFRDDELFIGASHFTFFKDISDGKEGRSPRPN